MKKLYIGVNWFSGFTSQTLFRLTSVLTLFLLMVTHVALYFLAPIKLLAQECMSNN